MRKTIVAVQPEPRMWQGEHGDNASVKVSFSDNSDGEYLAKPNSAQGHIDRLTGLIGKEEEYELEARKEYKGRAQWKIKNYPGKPQGQGGGFGGKGGKGGGDWETHAERRARMESHEATQVLGTARQLVADCAAYAENLKSTEDFATAIEELYPRLLKLVRENRVAYPEEKPGPGGQGGPGDTSAPDGTATVPTPGSDSSAGNGQPDKAAMMNQAMKLFGGLPALKAGYALRFKVEASPSEMTAANLAILVKENSA